MKIQSNHNSITFNAGLTSKMKSEIAHCDINKITKELAKSGISADFKNNKAVAWCSIKGIEIIKELNKKFNLNLAFPRGIYVEDFNNLLISDKMSAGFYNIAPKKLYMSNMGNTVVPQNVVFFNNFDSFQSEGVNRIWDNLDSIADITKKKKSTATNFFLETFLHELSHCIHFNHMCQNLSGQKLVTNINKLSSPNYLEKFRLKYDNLLKQICDYAAINPVEAVACDFSRRIINSINKNTLRPELNFIENSPYKQFKVFDVFKKEDSLDKSLRKFWNGKF